MEKNQFEVLIDKNKVMDSGNGLLTFKGGLTITDESEQRNGTHYDISEMDLSHFDGTVFADHDYSVTSVIGKAVGIAKRAKRVVVDAVQFAVEESSLAKFVHEMVKAGYINAVSIGTMAELDYETNTWHKSELLEFSFVGLGNNRSAKINQLALNTLQESEKNGLETKQLRSFLAANEVTVDDKKPLTNKNEESTMEEPKEPQTPETPETPEVPAGNETEQNSILDAVKNIAESVKQLSDEVKEVKKDAFNKNAAEPEFTPGITKVATKESALKSMDWRERTQMQVEKFYAFKKDGDTEAVKELKAINDLHKNLLVESGKIQKNVLGMGDFGNFVTSPELLTTIEGYRTDFSALLSVFTYRETNSLQMAWLNRSGEIDMEPVEMCDDGADGNLKPVSEYEATPRTNNLEEMAAVTPVCTAATIFLAADLLEDVGAGYRNSYERNLARGIIAALELAAEDNDTASIAETGDLDDAAGANAWLGDVRQAIFAISQGNGILVMNEATFGLIWNALLLTGNGSVLSQQGLNGDVPALWTKRIVVVPNELMPTLGTTDQYKTFSLNGSNVVINHAIFYVNPANFSGRQNGGLRYDLSTEAAYEVNGTVYSAYQRNEIVLRGSMFRGAVIRDHSRVGAVRAGAVIS